ncbi:MAG: glycosyltransferase family 39 protein, partial [Halothece sp. Uz-M2-17]|nr:glycosyltransferase family 39 protein [Halothece sp. Uz-M2-17]
LGLTENLGIGNSSFAIQLRILPALLGIIAIVLLYYLNQEAFSKKVGLASAGIIAISPFAVYLSQEARQYSLLLIFIAIALLALIQILRFDQRVWLYWLIWGAANSLGAYTHYFFLLSFVAQMITLFIFLVGKSPRRLFQLFTVSLAVVLSYVPWLPTLISHFSSDKTDWLPNFDWFAPIYQLLLGFIIMVVTFPVENQPTFVQVISGLVMLGFSGWLLYQVSIGYRKLLDNSVTQQVTLALSLYVVIVLVQFLVIIYGLEKNIAIAPRYNYIYYPAICSLLGASLIARTEQKSPQFSRKLFSIYGWVGIISCLFVVWNFFFLKPYFPEVTAERLNQSSEPMLIAMGYQDEMDLAIGLSYGLALNQIRDPSLTSEFIFLDRRQGYDQIWRKLSDLPLEISQVWVIGTGLKQVDFPENLSLIASGICQRDRANYYRIGIPYQRYNCESFD